MPMLMPLGLGALVGLVLALTGAGGGILAVPLLIFVLHMDVAASAPVALMAVGLAAALGALLGLREGKVRYKAAMLIGGAGMLLAPLGVWLARQLPAAPLTLGFAGVLAYVAWTMDRRARGLGPRTVAQPPCVRNPGTGRFIWTRPCAMALASTGLGSGLLSGLLGVGGGFVIVPALTKYSDLGAESVVMTSMAVIALVSVSGVASAGLSGAIDWPVALPFAAGAMLALLAARRVAQRWAGARLQRGFAMLCAAVAVGLLIKGLAAL